MSGHSKWSTIKHKKAVQDSKRSSVFTKLAKAITIAAREGGEDISANFKLRLAVDKAKQLNMPKKNIENAIKRGSGASEGEDLAEVVYEGYGPGKIAVMVEMVTDNRNRSVAELKKVFERHGGVLGQSGSVGFLFNRKGRLVVSSQVNKDEAMLKLIDLGVDDVEGIEAGIEVLVEPSQLSAMKVKLESQGLTVLEAELFYKAKGLIKLDKELTDRVIDFLEMIDDLDDVQNVYSNLEF